MFNSKFESKVSKNEKKKIFRYKLFHHPNLSLLQKRCLITKFGSQKHTIHKYMNHFSKIICWRNSDLPISLSTLSQYHLNINPSIINQSAWEYKNNHQSITLCFCFLIWSAWVERCYAFLTDSFFCLPLMLSLLSLKSTRLPLFTLRVTILVKNQARLGYLTISVSFFFFFLSPQPLKIQSSKKFLSNHHWVFFLGGVGNLSGKE